MADNGHDYSDPARRKAVLTVKSQGPPASGSAEVVGIPNTRSWAAASSFRPGDPSADVLASQLPHLREWSEQHPVAQLAGRRFQSLWRCEPRVKKRRHGLWPTASRPHGSD